MSCPFGDLISALDWTYILNYLSLPLYQHVWTALLSFFFFLDICLGP